MTDPLRAASSGSRLPQLDGLRGLAAVIVVLHHSMLLSPGFASTYSLAEYPPVGSGVWWLSATPLKLFTAGGEAVTIFFVLSGLVLTLPVLRARSFDWTAYYPRRLVRIYLPAAASVLFAVVLLYLVPSREGVSYGPWADRFTAPLPGVSETLAAMDLVFGYPYINNPLWSLRWEVLFSLMLPVFVGLALLLTKRPALWIGAAAGVTALGLLWRNDSLGYLPAFLAGAIIAVSLSLWENRAHRLSALRAGGLRIGAVWWSVITVAALLMLISYWLIRPQADASLPLNMLTRFLGLLGAVLIVLIGAFWAPAVRLLSTRAFQFLGVVSFSLYLVHVPIAFAAIRLIGTGHWYLATGATIVLAFGLSIVFTRFIEQPAHRLSRRVGSVFSNRVRDARQHVAAETAAAAAEATAAGYGAHPSPTIGDPDPRRHSH